MSLPESPKARMVDLIRGQFYCWEMFLQSHLPSRTVGWSQLLDVRNYDVGWRLKLDFLKIKQSLHTVDSWFSKSLEKIRLHWHCSFTLHMYVYFHARCLCSCLCPSQCSFPCPCPWTRKLIVSLAKNLDLYKNIRSIDSELRIRISDCFIASEFWSPEENLSNPRFKSEESKWS